MLVQYQIRVVVAPAEIGVRGVAVPGGDTRRVDVFFCCCGCSCLQFSTTLCATVRFPSPTMPPRTARLFAILRSLRPVHAAPCLAAAVGGTLLYAGAESVRLGRWENPLLVHAHSHPQPVFRVDPETSIEFPLSLPLATPSPTLTLVGLGVRKVSFLKIKVYSAGFYLQDGATRCLHHIPGWAVSPCIPAPLSLSPYVDLHPRSRRSPPSISSLPLPLLPPARLPPRNFPAKPLWPTCSTSVSHVPFGSVCHSLHPFASLSKHAGRLTS